MLNFMLAVVLTALLSAFVVILIGKVGLTEKMQMSTILIISKLFSCQFCLSFWVAVLIALVISVCDFNLIYIFVPVFSTPLSRILL